MQMRLSQIILLIFISLITGSSENYYEEGIVEISWNETGCVWLTLLKEITITYKTLWWLHCDLFRFTKREANIFWEENGNSGQPVPK